jgi:hypothetical protein
MDKAFKTVITNAELAWCRDIAGLGVAPAKQEVVYEIAELEYGLVNEKYSGDYIYVAAAGAHTWLDQSLDIPYGASCQFSFNRCRFVVNSASCTGERNREDGCQQ